MLKLKRIRWQALISLVLLFSITLGIIIGSANANIVPASYASESSHLVTANQLKPAECVSLDLSNIVILSLGESSTDGNDLILGTDKRDTVDGGDGDDCIVGGDKNNDLSGGNGNDIILGGDKRDTISGGAGNDICYGGGGNNAITTCETSY